MTGLQFEQYLEWLFRQLGYKVEITSYQGDFGADLVVSKNGVKTAVQAKSRSKRSIGIRAIQEAVAAAGHYKCQQSMVVTNSFFTRPAIRLAKDNKVELWNRDCLVDKLLAIRKTPESDIAAPGIGEFAFAVSTEGPTCAVCGQAVSEKVQQYCLDNQRRFDGRILCYRHQRVR